MLIKGDGAMEQEEFQDLVRYFKALADESRLKIVGVLASRECSVEELATLLGLKEPTVSHHLGKLKEIGLVRMRRDGTSHLYRLDAEALRAKNRELFSREKVASLADDVASDAWERRVLQSFLVGERLKQIPASLKKQLVVLRWLAEKFEPGVRYPEREVNETIKRHHLDTAALRRALVDHRFMAREGGGGAYWRTPEAADMGAPAIGGQSIPHDPMPDRTAKA